MFSYPGYAVVRPLRCALGPLAWWRAIQFGRVCCFDAHPIVHQTKCSFVSFLTSFGHGYALHSTQLCTDKKQFYLLQGASPSLVDGLRGTRKERAFLTRLPFFPSVKQQTFIFIYIRFVALFSFFLFSF